MSQLKPREASAARQASGTAIESVGRGFLSLRDPAGASHAAGPPEAFPAYPQLTDFEKKHGVTGEVLSPMPPC